MVSAPLTFYMPTDFLAISQVFRYLFFYCAGVLCAQRLEWVRTMANGWLILSGLLFAGTLGMKTAGIEVPYIITGSLSIPACYGLSKLINKQSALKGFFNLMSRNSFIIYLLQMFVINAGAICWSKLHLQNILPFAIFMLLSICGAVFIPVYLSSSYKKLKIKLKLIS